MLIAVDLPTASSAVVAAFLAGAGAMWVLRATWRSHGDAPEPDDAAPVRPHAPQGPVATSTGSAAPKQVMQRHARRILDSLTEGVIGVDERGRVVFLNPAASGLLGWTPRDLMGVSFHHLAMHSDAEGREAPYEASALRRALEANETIELPETVLWTKDRTPTWVACAISPMQEGGRTVGAVLVIRDLRERLRAEQRFRQLLDAAPDAMVIADEAGRIVHANRRVHDVLGHDPADLVGEPVETLVPEGVRARHVGHREGYAQDPRPRPMGADLELHARRIDGSLIPVEISLAPIRTTEGLLVTAAIRDVTERRAVGERLRRNEVHLNEAQRLARLGSWEFDLASGQVHWSDELFRLFGLAPQSVQVDLDRLLSLVHADDRALVREVVDTASATGRAFTVLHRIVMPDGDVRVLEGRGRVVQGAGKPVRMHGTAQDMTEREEGRAILEGRARPRRMPLDVG